MGKTLLSDKAIFLSEKELIRRMEKEERLVMKWMIILQEREDR